jgi:hypothetical protein
VIHHKSLNRSAILYLRGLKNFIGYNQVRLVGAIATPDQSEILNESAPRNLLDALLALVWFGKLLSASLLSASLLFSNFV